MVDLQIVGNGTEPRGALRSAACDALRGEIAVPGDKSISHRAVILGGLAVGETRITGLLEGEDVLRTAAALRALGASVERTGTGEWRIHGVGVGGLAEPTDILDMGNSGTAARLLAGVLATHPITSFMTGDASLRRRPMQRVIVPLSEIGAGFVSRTGGRMPLAIIGAAEPVPVTYTLPVASAQVKSAVLLAGLNTPGLTTVVEPEATRDHTERMLRHFGGTVHVVAEDGARRISVEGQPELTGCNVDVPGDFSSAAFPIVAALLRPDSQLLIRNVGMNPGRIGLLTTLLEMGADIELRDERERGGEPVADLFVRGSRLQGVEVPPERAPSMIDEYPILAVAAAFAEGRTVMRGLAELRVKESDRLGVMADGLAACGVTVEAGTDSMTVTGSADGTVRGGATIATELDHRIAMSFLVLGMATEQPVTVDDAAPIATSFPGFAALLNGIGGAIAEAGG